jgi:X-Pro dipeptidyl-peptidase
MRPPGDPDAPVILTYSPYNTLSETTSPNLANDDLGQRYVPLGYARAVADVLGTRNSSGCWDYGGPLETRSGVDLVNFLAAQPWSNGRVGMIGGSYDGTTATMVASQGTDAPGLRAIVPIAGISRWYGYAYSHGIRYLGNTERPTDEGVDTPLAFDFGIARTPPTHPSDPAFADALLDRTNPCDSVEHTERGYDDSPDYNDFWRERDYLRHAREFRAAVLVAHGWQDYNVKQEEGVRLFEALREDRPRTKRVEGVPFKRLYMFQDGHGSPSAENWEPLLDRFFDRTLKGIANRVEREPEVLTEGRSADAASTGFSTEVSWPPPATRERTLYLSRGPDGGELTSARPSGDRESSYADTATQTEEASEQSPDQEANWLFYRSPPLGQDARLAGEAVLRAAVSVDRDHAHLTPVLVDVAPDGTTRTVSRGFLNLLYRHGLERARALPVGKPVEARVTLKPQDQLFERGHRIGVIVQSSNTAWAIPDDPGAGITLHHGGRPGSQLTLPLAGAPRASRLFGT